jgi:predicted DNA-binding transcriptional regulator YafY
MSKPAIRMLAVLELLQTHDRISGVELARRLEVDGRTLRRYIAGLEELGIPVMSELGRHGGYSLVAGFKLPPMMLTNDEALAMSLGLIAAESMGMAETVSAVASAQAKLERVLPAQLKQRVRALSETATIDKTAAVAVAGASQETLAAIASGAEARRSVRFAYQSRLGEASTRTFDPYGLVFRGGAWYASGMCQLRRQLRSFRLDRMQEVELTAERFKRPADFDTAAYLTHSIATMPRANAVEVLLHTDLQTAAAELGRSVGLLEPWQDSVLLRTSTDSIPWFARQLARLPFSFEVREPQELLAAVHAHGQQLLRTRAG